VLPVSKDARAAAALARRKEEETKRLDDYKRKEEERNRRIQEAKRRKEEESKKKLATRAPLPIVKRKSIAGQESIIKKQKTDKSNEKPGEGSDLPKPSKSSELSNLPPAVHSFEADSPFRTLASTKANGEAKLPKITDG